MRERGSIIAGEILADIRREEIFRKKYKRNTGCLLHEKRQCKNCKYRHFCEDKD